MLDYTNLFECNCGKLLPLGTEKCPYCGYDFSDPEKMEREDRKQIFIGIACIIWMIFAVSFIQLNGVEILIAVAFPAGLYIRHLHRVIKKRKRKVAKEKEK